MWRLKTFDEFTEDRGIGFGGHPSGWASNGSMNFLYGKKFREQDQYLADTFAQNQLIFMYVACSLQDDQVVVRKDDTSWQSGVNWAITPRDLKFEEIEIEF